MPLPLISIMKRPDTITLAEPDLSGGVVFLKAFAAVVLRSALVALVALAIDLGRGPAESGHRAERAHRTEVFDLHRELRSARFTVVAARFGNARAESARLFAMRMGAAQSGDFLR